MVQPEAFFFCAFYYLIKKKLWMSHKELNENYIMKGKEAAELHQCCVI